MQAQTIRQFGLTSEEVAREMASGALGKHAPGEGRPNFALAITGTAESDDEKNGVVCFAYAARNNGDLPLFSETQKFAGSRNQVRSRAARYAIRQLPELFRHLTAR